MLLWIIVLGAAAWWAWNRWTRHHTTGAGASSDARARELRTPRVRLASAVGISTRSGRLASRYEAGAAGERATAELLDSMTREGWTILHDRALPTGRANVDHLAISPTGVVLMPDTKRWSVRYPVTACHGRLWHGNRDVTLRLRGIHHEARTASRVLGVPVTPVIAMQGAELRDHHGRTATELRIDGVRIVPAEQLPAVLRAAGRVPGQRRGPELAAHAARALPPYR